jgi:hypothetical protein
MVKMETHIIETNKLKNLQINDDVKQVLLGSLLGDASLFKTSLNASYSCSHSPKQKDYLFWKGNSLSKYFRTRVRLRNNGPKYKLYVLRTNCSPILTPLHSLCYVQSNKPNRKWEKIIDLSFLEQLNPLGLAVWYCDDGTYCVRDMSCALMTQGFSHRENLILKDYFLKKWGINVCVTKDHRSYINKTYYKLVFNKVEAQKFLTLISDFVPESMTYKLGHLSDKNHEILENEKKRYKLIRKKWYYSNHERALERSSRYRKKHRFLINEKRVLFYHNDVEKSRESGRKTMRKRRLINRERVNLINKDYYHRNKDRINKKRRERLRNDAAYREKKNWLQRESYYRIKNIGGV